MFQFVKLGTNIKIKEYETVMTSAIDNLKTHTESEYDSGQ